MSNLHPLKKWRDANNVLPGEMGEKIGCARPSVYRYEAGRMPEQPFLDRIVILTDGEVTANDWLGAKALRAVAKRRRDKSVPPE